MRVVFAIIATLLGSIATLSAQQIDGDIITLEPGDSSAMAIIAGYGKDMPHLYFKPMQTPPPLPPHIEIGRLRLSSLDRIIWQQNRIRTIIRTTTPIFNDYNSVTLRFGSNGHTTLTISNGSAYNYMPWPNSPIGYRDARTLSFPLR